jgi:hypothetical protein
MSTVYSTGASLGPTHTGILVGYQLVDRSGTVVSAWTGTGVTETSIHGDYTVAGGITLPAGFLGTVLWGLSGQAPLASESVDGPLEFDPNPFPANASLGASYTGLTIGYKLVDSSNTVVVAWTSTGVVESAFIPGDYSVPGEITLPSGFSGRIVWGTSTTDLAEEWINAAQPGVSAAYALDPFQAKVTPSAVLKQVLGSSQTWTVTACYAGKPKTNVFTSNDALDAKIYQGDSQAILFSPVVSWVDPSAGTIQVSVSSTQTASAEVSAGLYRIEVGVTPQGDSNRHVALYSSIRFVGTSGTASAPASLVSWPNVLTYSSDVAKLEQQDTDQTQFAEQRGAAMNLFIQEIVRRYSPRPGGSRRYVSEDGTTAGPYLRFAPSPDGSPPPTREQLQAWLAQAGRLAINEDIVEANARFAAALVYGSSPGQNSPYQQMADKERGLARAAIQRAKIDIDSKTTPDGNPTIRVDRDVVYLT